MWVCYIISNRSVNTYVGISNRVHRRLRQHGGEIQGGARATRGKGPWYLEACASGFTSKSQCLSFEWHVHHIRPRGKYIGSVEKRLRAFRTILDRYPDKFYGVSYHIYDC